MLHVDLDEFLNLLRCFSVVRERVVVELQRLAVDGEKLSETGETKGDDAR